ncbi:hypothetical protein QGN29_12600 [Temperatibacter marinus]|uniref:Uncharacterized protein n=1 Tax=Temperatibacter marinus TaxID=1456591 RepID=A0AA52HA58_9PROT|nr:hypothetical protein [Temperatibacter marinus]WND02390.1 hypothetical protein QGN29_12600 [Temperatibacter marinus]
MNSFIDPTVTLVIFYTIFISQIFVLSLYFPYAISQRITNIVSNYPPDEYPKLYPNYSNKFVGRTLFRMKIFKTINALIAALGFTLLGLMLGSGYTPAQKGGDEIFVMFYFILQTLPIAYIQISEAMMMKAMRNNFDERIRRADLSVRRLSDYISPLYVVIAAFAFVICMTYFILDKGPINQWEIEVFITVGTLSIINLVYGYNIYRTIYGKKVDPYKATKDQEKLIKTVVQVTVISSIMISVFIFCTQFADRNDLEVLDPPLVSFYLQLCAILGMGLAFKNQQLQDIDFSVYKEELDDA